MPTTSLSQQQIKKYPASFVSPGLENAAPHLVQWLEGRLVSAGSLAGQRVYDWGPYTGRVSPLLGVKGPTLRFRRRRHTYPDGRWCWVATVEGGGLEVWSGFLHDPAPDLSAVPHRSSSPGR